MLAAILLGYLAAGIQAAPPVPEWTGEGRYRLQVMVDPVDLKDRERDELVAEHPLDFGKLLETGGISGEVDLSSLQVHGYERQSGKPVPFTPFDSARSPYDRPCRFEDDQVPWEYPDRVGAASRAPDGRPPITFRPGGGRLFNRQMLPGSGRLVWSHTQVGSEPSHYAIYFDVTAEPGGSDGARHSVNPRARAAPAPWIGDVDLYRRETGQPLLGMSHLSVCAADFDGDGLFDLVAGVEKGQLMYFRNQGGPGRPKFIGGVMLADEEGPIDVGWYANPYVTDWDGDGLPDLLVGTQHNVVLWWKGTGVFQGGETDLPSTDGFQREEGLASPAQPRLEYQGFVQADGGRLEVPQAPVEEDHAGIFKVDYLNSPTVCDWDGDGLPDILTGGYTTGRIFYYRATGRDADGVPQLTYVGPLEADGEVIDTGWAAAPTAYDFTGDGKLELITGSWDFQQGHNPDRYLMYFTNDATRESPRLRRQPFPKEGAFPQEIIARASVVDWDDDGLADLLVSDHSGSIHVMLNKGSADSPRWLCDGQTVTGRWGFVPLSLAQGPEDYVILTYDHMITSTADVDGDGQMELMSGDEVHTLAGSPHSPELVRMGEITVGGRPLLHPGPGYGDEYNWNVFTDWDGDGALDVLCGTQQGNIFFHRAEPHASPPLQVSPSPPLSFAEGIKLRLTNGQDLKVGPPVHADARDVPNFTDLQGSRIKFVVADIDGDGIDDLVVTETYGNIWVFRNTRRGGTDTLEDGVKIVALPSRTRINTLDWNGDGKPDIIDGGTVDNPGRIHLNESEPGSVRFAEPIQPLELPWVFYGSGFFPIDWNRDGDEDLLIQSEFYFFWVERSFLQHGYRPARTFAAAGERLLEERSKGGTP